ncbi:MAG: hypothetical protein VYE68_15265 [Acidobacteriota bacterium]|nr:hypothetical protein [Acidobacteriota bacterium]
MNVYLGPVAALQGIDPEVAPEMVGLLDCVNLTHAARRKFKGYPGGMR